MRDLPLVRSMLFLLVLTTGALAQTTKGTNTAPPPSPTPKPAGSNATTPKTSVPIAIKQTKAGGEAGTISCDGKTAKTTMRKAGGEAGTISCNGKTATTMRKAGGEAGVLGCNGKPANAKTRKAGGEAGVVIAIRPNGLNGDGKTATTMRKAGGDPNTSKTQGAAGITDGASRKAGGTAGFTGGTGGFNTRKAGGQGIVRPNCSSATKGAVNGSTGGATKPNVPQTQVPK